jgi:hypothetical protein
VRDRLARCLRADERGASVVEVVATLAILGVVMAVFMTVVGSLQTAAARQDGRVRRNDEARLALAQLDREIRSGNVLYDPSVEVDASGDIVPNMSLRIYTQADAPRRGFKCSQWRVTNDTIQTRRWSAEGDDAGEATEWWTVATGIVNRSVSPEVPAFTLDDTAAYGGRIMKITLVVDRADDAGQPMTFDLSLTGRNTQYGYPSDVCEDVPAY